MCVRISFLASLQAEAVFFSFGFLSIGFEELVYLVMERGKMGFCIYMGGWSLIKKGRLGKS